MRTFREHLNEKKKDRKFLEAYNAEKELIELAVKIAEARNKLGISQQELAKRAKITQQQLSRVENGVSFNITTFLKICNALGMKINLTRSAHRV
ncbi:MAG TPA: helix-turn-helix transcriptional regulator [Spirochaetota bacterium]|nr:helix-turn-helix transcriptional regulator [Spirochaetota bacterium]